MLQNLHAILIYTTLDKEHDFTIQRQTIIYT